MILEKDEICASKVKFFISFKEMKIVGYLF